MLYGIAETMFGNWGTTLLVEHGVKPDSANQALAAFWAGVTIGRLVISLIAKRVRSTIVYLSTPWVIAVALVVAPAAKGAGAGIAVFLLGGLACSGFFPMSIGYGESTFPDLVELATGWLIASYQVGYGLAAFGSGTAQKVLSLSSIFRGAAVLTIAMSVLAIPIARRQHRPRTAVRQSGQT